MGPVRVGALGAGFYSGYVGLVPSNWQTALGGPALTGNADISIISRTSSGPAFAFDPDHLSATGAQPLVYYPQNADPSKVSAIDPLVDPVDPFCYDPSDGSKGVHGYPYSAYVWADDANDLASVHAGQKQPWDVTPYAVWTLQQGGLQ
jgi:hypothetical protein